VRKIGQYLLANNIRASIVALICILLPWPFNAAAAVIVGMVSLQRGVVAGLSVLAWVVLPAVAATWKAHEFALTYDIAFLICALTWLFAALLHWQRNWARVLELAAFLGMVVILGVTLVPHGIIMNWLAGLEKLVLDQLTQVMQIDAGMVKQVMEQHAYFLLGGLYATPTILALIYLMLARSWQLAIVEPEKRRLEFYVIRIRWVPALILLLMIAAAAISHAQWLGAMVVIACIPFVFAGLSLIMCVAAIEGRNKYLRMGLLIIAIAVLLFVAQIAILLLAFIGFIDSWINFRKLEILRTKRVNS